MKGKFVKEKHGECWHIFFEEDEDSFQVESLRADQVVTSTNNPFQLGGLPIDLCQTYHESHADFILEKLNG